ncbi:hypothetical protein [Paraburkholderia rhynchosiae]|uniref:hypothetical protein n=1 Tax=Paraburkholderia rhynchosiae TaxID=487049 RepID=UPI001304B824|nr:hypothetical protein [Paraburkholderia rhynchosiae]
MRESMQFGSSAEKNTGKSSGSADFNLLLMRAATDYLGEQAVRRWVQNKKAGP